MIFTQNSFADASAAGFHDGLERFKSYLKKKGADFSSRELIAIMDSFS